MFLAYHRIAADDSKYLYSVTRDQFDAHLEAIAAISDDRPQADFAPLVTFDDGHSSTYEYGVEILRKYSIRATFFVTAGWMSSQDGYMTWPELRELMSLGHSVQAHGWLHRVFTECSDSELEEELQRAKLTMEDRLNVPVEALSIPHGRWDDRVLKACAAAGYRRVYISDPWMPRQERHGMEIVGRYMVRRSMKAAQLRRLLAGDPAFVFFLRSQFRMKETLKQLVGSDIYHRLWSVLARANGAR
jgi:peptidoglycan/xylan/chitin deacetylase (PgdA/CDA1 family)